MELISEVRDAEEGGLYARALGYGIFTEVETWDELRSNVLEAAQARAASRFSGPRRHIDKELACFFGPARPLCGVFLKSRAPG